MLYMHVCAKHFAEKFNSSCRFNMFNSLPNDKILDVTKLKTIAEDKISVAQMMISVFDGIENIVGKRENVGYQIFSFSHNVFKSLLFQGR